MAEVFLRKAESSDDSALLALWQAVFGDPAEYISAFLRLLPKAGFGVVCVEDGKIAAMAYLLNGISIGSARCGYIYAVATHEAARGRGYGAAVTRACRDLAIAEGCEIITTEPASPSLFAWYEELLGAPAAVFCGEETILRGAPVPTAPRPTLLTAHEYNIRREYFLQNRPHAAFSDAYMEIQAQLCRVFSGGLYAVGDGIACVALEGDTLKLSELLCPPEQTDAALQSLIRQHGAARSLWRTSSGESPYISAAPPSAFPPNFHWGLSLD